MNAKKNSKRRKSADRIAMVSTHGYMAADPPIGEPDTGGQVIYVLELSRKFALMGYKVDIWTRQFEDQPPQEEVAKNVRILRVPCGGNEFIPKEYLYESLPEWTENALRKIKKDKLRYQFINSHYWDAGVASQNLANALNVIHVHTPHSLGIVKKQRMISDGRADPEEFEKEHNFSQRIHHEKLVYRESDLVVATAPPILDSVQQEYDIPTEKVKMIPPGYDDNLFFPVGESSRQVLRHQYGYEGKKVIAAAARLARTKGFDLLIEAFRVVLEREPDAYLRLATGAETEIEQNDPVWKHLNEMIADYDLQDHVLLTKAVSFEGMPDYYRSADVFALPCRYEAFGMTGIEAMACGTPSVLTVHSGLVRTVSYGAEALYGDPFDKEDFGITLLKALRYKSLRQRLSLQGARKMRSLFTWTGIAQQLLRAVEGRE
ncbi:glycosyltransferase [candidate division KSB3 bacterium]|uniref:sucrose-phosphate synthase n=1 Tax=candidate division KSB3 bacterium TaxID=2044937 RepID=A0A9D5JU51_9BACT|nr:glycosyltransferase [candidate division KSB3 bacterium]MBD3323992.1 glycosyltransferase [candidate division KSB3 bacterium]